MALTVLTGGPLTGSRNLIAVAAAILLISACSGDSSQSDSTTTPTASDVETETTAAEPSTTQTPPDTPAENAEPEEPTASAGCSLDDFTDGDSLKPASCGGSATVVLGDETIVFDSFACFTGADAVEATRSERTTFSSIGVVSHGGSLAAVVVSVQDTAIPIYDIAFAADVDSDLVWYGQANSGPVAIDGNHVTFEGEFAEASGGSTATGAIEAGSIDATCAP